MANTVSTPLNDRIIGTGTGFSASRVGGEISREAAASGIYMGSTYSYTPGSASGTSGAATVAAQDYFIPKEQAWAGYGALSPEANALLVEVMDAKAGTRNWNMEELKKTWSEGVMLTEYITAQTGQPVTVLDALRGFYLDPNGIAGFARKDGKGGSKAYTGPVTQVRLSDPMTAETLLDNSLKNYLGRSATNAEKANFLKALNAYERENPTVTTPSGPGYSITTGGAQPTAFAEEYAASQEGAAEFQAATTYLDAFLGSLGNPVG